MGAWRKALTPWVTHCSEWSLPSWLDGGGYTTSPGSLR